MSLDGFTIVLGVLGAYFAILMVLSVSVETLLEPLTWFSGLRKKVSPDDVLQSVREWLPDGSEEAVKVVAIQTFVQQTQTNMEEVNKNVDELRASAIQALTEMGLEAQVDTVQKDIALKMATLRQRHLSNEKSRITALRVMSALIGIAVAWVMGLNSFEILGVLFPENIMSALNSRIGQIGGIIVTGLAASAGSSFWHDMLGRVRNIKNVTQEAQKISNNVANANTGGGGAVG